MNKLLAALLLGLSLTTGAIAQHMDINELIAGIGGEDFLDATSTVDSASSVRIVRLSSLAGAAEAAGRLAEVADIKQSDVDYLRGRVFFNPIAVSALRNAGVALDQIVTLQGTGGNAVVLYADDL